MTIGDTMSYPQQPGQFGPPPQQQQYQNQPYAQPGFPQQGYGQPGGYQQPGYGARGGAGMDKILAIVGMALAAIHLILALIGLFRMLGAGSDYGVSVSPGAEFWIGFLLTVAVDCILITLGIRAAMKKN